MKDILFTNADFIRSVTIVSDNLQDKYILSSIREAQDIEFQQVIGTRLYNKLKMMVEDESILFDFNVHYRELLDKAQYFIAYQTLANLTVNSTYKINNVGLNTISDDNVSTPSLSDTFKLAKYYVDKADHYKMMLQNWLLKNKSYFPELLKSAISELSANVHSAASCNVFLGGARGKVSRVPSTLKDESQEASKPFTTGELTVTDNGVYLPKDQDLDAFSKVTVEVQIPKFKVQDNFGDFLKKTIPDENKCLDLRMFDTSEVTDLNNALSFLEGKVNYIDIRGWDTSKVENMDGLFRFTNVIEIYGIEDIDTSNVTNMNFLFNQTKIKELNLPKWDVRKVTTMQRMVETLDNLTSVSLNGWETSACTDMSYLFTSCKSLASIDISSWDTSNVQTMNSMFQYNPKLTDIKFNFRTPNLTNMHCMFDGCNSLISLDLSMFDVSKVTDMFAAFNDCRNLTYLNLSNWNMSAVSNINRMLDGLGNLTTLIMDGAIFPKKDLDIYLSNSNNLTVESLVSVLNALQQLDNGESHYIQLGSTNIDKLSDDQKAIAINKGWVLQ